ncbi:hypothetical protein TWF694_009270 [Orbilia ellipsospora]|uniref:Uncharacterized protein n=1 Tax=Orbilia ellipsospora TaxID=2528407 RepID=A0AAV9XH59_9PEZI
MRLQLFSASLFLSAAVQAAIDFQTFPVMGCVPPGRTIQSDQANAFDSSGCVNTGIFQSVGVVSMDPGFVCNIYLDTACQKFFQVFDGSTPPQTCINIVGQSVSCFNQQLFNNPYAESLAQVTIGQNRVVSREEDSIADLVQFGKSEACTDTGCDSDSIFLKFDTECLEVVMSGSFGSANERDYLANVLGAALSGVVTNQRSTVSFENIRDTPDFATIDIFDTAKQSKIATMSVFINNSCLKDTSTLPVGETCDQFLSLIPPNLLEAVPAVSGVVSSSFQINCDPTR